VNFPLCIGACESGLGFGGALGTFYIFYDSGLFFCFFILIFKRGGSGGGRGNLGGIVGLAYA